VLPKAAKPIVAGIQDLITTGRAGEALARVSEIDAFERDNPAMVRILKGMLLADIAEDLGDGALARQAVLLQETLESARLPKTARALH